MKRHSLLIRKLVPVIFAAFIPLLAGTFVWRNEVKQSEYRIQSDLEQNSEKISRELLDSAKNNSDILKGLSQAILSNRKQGNSFSSSFSQESFSNYLDKLSIPYNNPEIEHIGFIKKNLNSGEFVNTYSYKTGNKSTPSYREIFEVDSKYYPQAKEEQAIALNSITKNDFSFARLTPSHAAIYLPIYDSFLLPESQQEREDKLVAVVFYYFNINKFLSAKDDLFPGVGFSARISSETSGSFPQVYVSDELSYVPSFRHSIIIKANNVSWILSAYSKPLLEKSYPVNTLLIFLITGFTSVMLSLITVIIITSRERAIKMAEKMMFSLRKSEEDFRNSFNSTNTGMVLVNADLSCGKSNKAFQRISGYSEEELKYTLFDQIVPFDEKDAEAIKKAHENKLENYHLKRVLKKKNGQEIWINFDGAVMRDSSGKVRYFIINVEDITEEIAYQQKIERSEKRLKLTLDASQIGIWDWDPAKDISNWDKTIYSFIGIDKRQKSPRSLKYLLSIITPDFRELVQQTIMENVQKKHGFNIEFTIARLDNKELRRLHIVGHPVPSNNKLGVEYVGVCSDRTEEHKLDQLKSNFVSVASHQLRTPLTAIRWFREMIVDNLEKEPLTPKQEKLMNKIEESSHRMLDLVDDLLQVSRLDNQSVELKPTKYDLLDVTKRLIDQVAIKLKEKDQKISVTCALKDVAVFADKTFTEQVMQNLITNALKYSPAKTHVKIKITGEKSHLKWSIADQGIGIAEEDRSKVFQQFFRSKEASESKADGSGLGLYIAKSIIELSGGILDFTSKHGKGSTFWFTLPKK